MTFGELHEQLAEYMQGVFYPHILTHTNDAVTASVSMEIGFDVRYVYGDYVHFDRDAYVGDEEHYTVSLALWSEDVQVSPDMETRYEIICTHPYSERVFDEVIFDSDTGITFQDNGGEPLAPFEFTEEHVQKGKAAIDHMFDLIQEEAESARLDFEERHDRHPYW